AKNEKDKVRRINKATRQAEKATREMRSTVKAFYNMREPTEFQGWRDAGAALKALASMQRLGSVLLSATPELAAGLSTLGARGYLRHFMSTAFDNKRMRELSKIQLAEMHVGFQMSSAARISEHGEFDIGSNKFTRGMTRTADIVVDKLYGLGPWTRAAEIQVGTATRGKFGRLMLKEKLSATDRTELARLGFGA
ncbi:MAG: hypothetical protein GY703_22535, partial [Gammaproteobacteria bacterium]|nr:hypothetical protein [Gammaproteobacteria bacterium]